MNQPAMQVAKARRNIRSGLLLLNSGFHEEAARDAYMAAFHAALAYIAARTGKEPRTHRGTHVELARLQNERQEFSHDFVAFLGRSYEFKDVADYQGNGLISSSEASSALETAAKLIDAVELLVRQPSDP